MGYVGRPEDVSGTVLFLASEGSLLILPARLFSVDGGLT